MLSEHENKLMCEVGPGTAMGELFRRFWMPALLSEELPAPDCDPRAIRLLGEDLVAFRDTEGKVGVVEALCAHRRVNLFWGRNEECGLRCTYHGWKYDREGNCVDMPNEPPENRFKDRIKLTAYPTREAGGIVWAYMGPQGAQPAEVPRWEWVTVPDSHRLNTKRLQECNWAQAVEGGLDSSHTAFLHSKVESHRNPSGEDRGNQAPVFFPRSTPFGMLTAVRSDRPENQYNWRLVPFLLPSGKIVPSLGGAIGSHIWVPIDDDNVFTYTTTWHPDRPLSDEERSKLEGGASTGRSIHAEVDKDVNRWDIGLSNAYQAKYTIRNNYLIDREDQRNVSYTGIKGFSEQDFMIQESMGRVAQRHREHLGTVDREIIDFRQCMLNLVRELLEGKEPEAPQHPESYTIRSAAFNADRGVSLDEVFDSYFAGEYMTARS